MAASVEALVKAVQQDGVDLVVDGGKLLMIGSEGHEARLLEWLPKLREHKASVIAALKGQVTVLPKGVGVLSWNLKKPPIMLNRCSIVIDPGRFAEATLRQLEHALNGRTWLAGNLSPRDLCERLEQVGVRVCVEGEAAAAMIPGLRENRAKSSNQRRRSL